MSDTLSLALVGIVGHGDVYLKGLFAAPPSAGIRFTAVIDPKPEQSPRFAELKLRGIPIYQSLEAFYAAEGADLIVLATPPYLHAEQTCHALSQGSHVFCEKPLATHPEQIELMLDAKRRARKQVAIGYQWSFSPAIQHLKRDIAAGVFGSPRRFKTRVFWQRGETYYSRNTWAGRLRDDRGNWICDSPLNNACAHYLHNLFYLLGDSPDRSAWPAKVTAELYRAHRIENYDTAVLRCLTREDVEIFCVVSHVTKQSSDPLFSLEFDEAIVSFDESAGTPIVARFRNGDCKTYGIPHDGYQMHKVWETASAIREGVPVVCGIEAAVSQTACIWAAQQSTDSVIEFPAGMIHRKDSSRCRHIWVDGLDADLERCYQEWRLPAELSLPWAHQARIIQIAQSSMTKATESRAHTGAMQRLSKGVASRYR